MRLAGLFFITLLALVFTTTALAQGNIRESFACNFNDGQNMDDLMSARDFYLEQAKKAGIDPPVAFVWTPLKVADQAFDLLWFNNHADLAAFAMATDADVASPEMAAVLERFNSVVDCTSSISAHTMVYDGGEAPVTTPPAFIDAYACHFASGMGVADLDDMWKHHRIALNGLGIFTDMAVYTSVPITSGPHSADIYIYGVHDTASAWAARKAALASTDIGQSLGKHVNSVLDCDMALFHGQRIVSPVP